MANPMEPIKEPLPGNLLPLQPQELDNSASHNLGYGSPHTQGIHNALEESRWQRDFDHVTLSTARPWQTGLSALPTNVVRQLLGLNPFKTSYFALYRPLKDFKSQALLFAAVILALAAGVPLPIIGVVFGKIINNFPPTEDELITRLTQLMGVAVAYFVLTWGWAVSWGIIGEKVSRGLREELVERALGMELAFYDTEAPDMTSVLTDKTQTIQLGTSEKVGLFVQSISYFFAAFTVGFILDARLTGILFAGVIPTMAIIVYTGTKVVSKMSKKAAECTDQAATIAESAIRGVQVVQAFGISQALADDYEAMLRRAVRFGVRKAFAGAAMLGLVYFTAYAANALAFWEGRRLQEQRLGPDSEGAAGTIYAVVFLILDASFVVGQFGPFIQTFALAAAAGSSIFAILDRPESHINVYSKEGDNVSEDDMQKDIAFQDVIFVYPARPAVRVLDSLSIKLKSGQVNGVVGSSGSGKSTLASLLVRLYDPTSGQIKIGNKDIRRFNIAELRKHVAIVEQESVLFSGTILENVAFGLPDGHDLSVEEIEKRCRESLKEAHCDFVDNLPDGIHSLIGGKGASSLSGGQKQRLCLARALVRKPTLLILDEYTSAMDATSESIILEHLRESSHENNRTTVVIAHRLATVKDADNILVMTDGALVEEGTHEKLVESDGVYAGLVRAQGFEKKRGMVSRQASWETNLIKSPTGDKKTKKPADEAEDAEDIAHSGKKFSAATLVRRCLSLSKSESPLIVLGLLASTVSGAIIVGEAIVFGNLVNLLNSPRTPETNADSNFFCLIFFILALTALFAYATSGSMFGIVSEKLILRIQCISLQTILSQDMSWFSKAGNSPHLLMSKLSMDAGHIGGLSGIILGTFFSVATSICGGIILAHVVAWRIAVVLLAAVPVMVLAGFARLKVLSKAEERHQSAYGDAAATASEACAAIRTVAILGREHTFLKKYKEQVEKPYKEGMKFTLTANILLAFSLSITYFVYTLAYWWGAQNVRAGYYSVLDFFIVLPALLFSAQAAGQMFSLSPEITRAKTAAQSIFTLHAQKPTIMPSLGSHPEESSDNEDSSLELKKGRQDGTIEFRNISLAYPSRPNALALNGISLTIAPGTFAAFVGRSGAGKTSSIALIERFFDPNTGEVLIDGQDIRTMSIEQHRARVSLVEQEPDLFPGSIRYNVSLGARPGHKPSDKEIENVCQMCGLHAFIMSLPDAYNTDCGKNGSQLSGGQKQRLAIARALLRNPDILLLDEATSQLDANTEQDLRRAIAAASAGRTTVMVAHRLASIQRADRIFVFDHGKVVEQGSHDELVEQGGIYAGMVAAQELS